MKTAGILGLSVLLGAINAEAAVTARVEASTMVSGNCAVAAPSSVPGGAAGQPVNVNCTSGSTYAVTVDRMPAPASGVPAINPASSTTTITY